MTITRSGRFINNEGGIAPLKTRAGGAQNSINGA